MLVDYVLLPKDCFPIQIFRTVSSLYIYTYIHIYNPVLFSSAGIARPFVTSRSTGDKEPAFKAEKVAKRVIIHLQIFKFFLEK